MSNVNDLYVLDLLQDKTKMAFKRIVSLSYPEYATEISIAKASGTETRPLLPVSEVSQSGDSAQNPDSR